MLETVLSHLNGQKNGNNSFVHSTYAKIYVLAIGIMCSSKLMVFFELCSKKPFAGNIFIKVRNTILRMHESRVKEVTQL